MSQLNLLLEENTTNGLFYDYGQQEFDAVTLLPYNIGDRPADFIISFTPELVQKLSSQPAFIRTETGWFIVSTNGDQLNILATDPGFNANADGLVDLVIFNVPTVNLPQFNDNVFIRLAQVAQNHDPLVRYYQPGIPTSLSEVTQEERLLERSPPSVIAPVNAIFNPPSMFETTPIVPITPHVTGPFITSLEAPIQPLYSPIVFADENNSLSDVNPTLPIRSNAMTSTRQYDGYSPRTPPNQIMSQLTSQPPAPGRPVRVGETQRNAFAAAGFSSNERSIMERLQQLSGRVPQQLFTGQNRYAITSRQQLGDEPVTYLVRDNLTGTVLETYDPTPYQNITLQPSQVVRSPPRSGVIIPPTQFGPTMFAQQTTTQVDPLVQQSFETLMKQIYGLPVELPASLTVNGLEAEFIPFQRVMDMYKQGQLDRYIVEPIYQPWAGPPGTTNRILTVFSKNGVTYLSKARTDPTTKQFVA